MESVASISEPLWRRGPERRAEEGDLFAAVGPIRLNRVAVDERTVRAVIAFVLLYVGIFVVGAVLLLMEAHRAELGLSPFDAIAASATTLGNVGPAFAGPMGSFAPFSDVSKGIMIVLMWIGRLEIVPVAVLLTRAYWQD